MKPTPGKLYTTQSGDTLEKIAGQAYGQPNRWPDITAVNQQSIKASSTETLPARLTLIIPANNKIKALRAAQLANGLS